MRLLWKIGPARLGLTRAVAAGGCGGDEGPNPFLVIAKAPTKTGDSQTGTVGETLIDDLRVQVTRDGAPAEGVAVSWSTGSGSVAPTSSQTDVNGIAVTAWTLGSTVGTQTATATLAEATGSPLTFTATAVTP